MRAVRTPVGHALGCGWWACVFRHAHHRRWTAAHPGISGCFHVMPRNGLACFVILLLCNPGKPYIVGTVLNTAFCRYCKREELSPTAGNIAKKPPVLYHILRVSYFAFYRYSVSGTVEAPAPSSAHQLGTQLSWSKSTSTHGLTHSHSRTLAYGVGEITGLRRPSPACPYPDSSSNSW